MLSKLIFALTLFIASPAFATFVPQADSIQCSNGVTKVITTSLITLAAIAETASYHAKFMNSDGTAYTPSGGKSFRVLAVKYVNNTGYGGKILYSAQNISGFSQASAPTSSQFYANPTVGNNAGPGPIYYGASNPGGNYAGPTCIDFVIPNAKYGYFYASGFAGDVQIWGQEE